MAEEKINHLRELEDRLYSKDPKRIPSNKYGILRPIKQKVSDTWGDTKIVHEKEKRNNLKGYKKFFIFSVCFFVIGAAIAYFSIYRGVVLLSSKNVEMTILGNSFATAGSSIPVDVEIANKNSSDLLNATLTLISPKGASQDATAEFVRNKITLGTIPSGKTKSQSFSVILYGEQGLTHTVRATLEYQLPGATSIFVKQTEFNVLINASPLAMTVDAPSSVAPNQPFVIKINDTYIGDDTMTNALVKVDYPNGFVFDSAIPAPASGNNIWTLGDLLKNSQIEIALKGKLIGERGDEKAFKIFTGNTQASNTKKLDTVYNSVLKVVTIDEPTLTAALVLNGSNDDTTVISKGTQIKGKINFVNNSGNAIVNPVFTVSLEGESYDPASIVVEGGEYDSVHNQLIWNSQTSDSLAAIAALDKGSLAFSFNTSSSDTSALAPITLDLSIAGSIVDANSVSQDFSTNTIDQKKIVFASRLQFAAAATYSIGAFKNTGPYPPRVGKETTYTISWTVKPTDNPLTDTIASAALPQGVVYMNTVSPTTENLTYDPVLKTMIWKIGVVPKQTQVNQSRTVSFQVKLKPTKAQTETEVALLGPTTINATDSVVGTKITTTKGALSTSLVTDPNYTLGQEKVLP